MADNKKEKELNKLFDQNSSKDSFAKIIGKARRKSIIRNIIISALVLLFLAVVAGFSWLSIMRWSETKASRDIQLFSEITDPNTEEMGIQIEGNGLLEGILRFDRYKVIEGIPVDWSEEVMTYSLFGGVSGFAGDHSPIQVQEETGEQVKAYDRKTKQRVLGFYHPEVEYHELANDLSELENFSDDTAAEVALSFDQQYTASEIREAIPEEITLKWFWADTYSAEDLDWMNHNTEELEEMNLASKDAVPELANQVYGFEENQQDPSTSEDRFINIIKAGLSMEDGKYYSEYKRIHENLKGDSSKLTEENIDIIGAVVTGSAEDLMVLEDSDLIRASVLGVTVNPYQ